MALFFIGKKTFDLCQYGKAHTASIHDQNCRCLRHCRQIIGAGLRVDTAQTVIVAHDAFHHGDIRILGSPLHQITGRLLIGKKGIEIPGFRSQHPGMKHGVDVVRAAFKGGDPKPPFS